MNKLRSAFALACTALLFLSPLVADAARVRVVRHGPHFQRHAVVIHTGHPIRRVMHPAIIVRPGVTVRVAPARFLPVVVWTAVVVTRPVADRIVWQDSESLSREDEWSEINFNSDQRGEKLFLEVAEGKVQFDFAEVVFENGECQVVDFKEKTHKAGVYSLLDFKDGRKIDHVRVVARAKSAEAEVRLLLQK